METPNSKTRAYPASLDIEYPARLDRLTTFFRLAWIVPILGILTLLTGTGGSTVVTDTGEQIATAGGGIAGGLFVATVLMIVFRQKYPRWWFDFAREMARFSTRVCAYLGLLTDRYPSTDEPQGVNLAIEYPDAQGELNRWLPLVKWFLAIPHYVVLFVLASGAVAAILVAWFAILFTGRYPRRLFDYVVGVGRWALRVQAYAFLLVTDEYPPFRLD